MIGESAYALNENLAGKKFFVGTKVEVPPLGVVILFETDLGYGPPPREGLVKSRDFFNKVPEAAKEEGSGYVYEKRWNQTGSASNLYMGYHDTEGCLVYGYYVKGFVKPEEIKDLRWEIKKQGQ
jgi:hypothetical protein